MRQTRQIALIAGLAAVGLFVPASGASQPTSAHNESAVSDPAARAISRLLEADTTPGKAKLETIKPVYQQGLTSAPRDARLEYACYLVLLRIFEPTEARKHLLRSLELDPAFTPANQAVIRELVKGRKYTEAGERLARFVEQLDPRRPDSARAAEWIGRIVSAVITAVGTPDAQAEFAYHDRVFRTSLPPALLANYERGFMSVEHELDALAGAIDEARSSAANRRETAKAEIDANLKKDEAEIKLKQQDAQKSRQKWDEWVVDQTAKADDMMREHEKRFQDLDNAITAQQQAVTALRLAIDRAERGITSAAQQLQAPQQQRRRQTQQPVFTGAFTVPNPASIELQLAVEEQRLANLFDQQAAVSRQATQVLAARRGAVAQYQQATGVALKEAANLDRWESRNKTVAENMKKAAEKKPLQVASLDARIKNLNTWDPSDFQTDKRRLLADLDVSPQQHPPPAPAPK
jgi:hypothetical protein